MHSNVRLLFCHSTPFLSPLIASWLLYVPDARLGGMLVGVACRGAALCECF